VLPHGMAILKNANVLNEISQRLSQPRRNYEIHRSPE
jgi:hypothetical protein